MKPERLRIFGRLAKDLATLAKCTKRGVAAVIVDKEGTQVHSIGINGGPAGGLDCLCGLSGKYSCIHAEVNAIAKCNSTATDKIMICTLSPCVTCASLIVNSGFKTFYYLEAWKETTGLDLLIKSGIQCKRIWLTNEEE